MLRPIYWQSVSDRAVLRDQFRKTPIIPKKFVLIDIYDFQIGPQPPAENV
jgi:hypothetical protein